MVGTRHKQETSLIKHHEIGLEERKRKREREREREGLSHVRHMKTHGMWNNGMLVVLVNRDSSQLLSITRLHLFSLITC